MLRKWGIKRQYGNFINSMCDNYKSLYYELPESRRKGVFIIRLNETFIKLYIQHKVLSSSNFFFKENTLDLLLLFCEDDIRLIIFSLLCFESEELKTLVRSKYSIITEMEVFNELIWAKLQERCILPYDKYQEKCHTISQFIVKGTFNFS